MLIGTNCFQNPISLKEDIKQLIDYAMKHSTLATSASDSLFNSVFVAALHSKALENSKFLTDYEEEAKKFVINLGAKEITKPKSIAACRRKPRVILNIRAYLYDDVIKIRNCYVDELIHSGLKNAVYPGCFAKPQNEQKPENIYN